MIATFDRLLGEGVEGEVTDTVIGPRGVAVRLHVRWPNPGGGRGANFYQALAEAMRPSITAKLMGMKALPPVAMPGWTPDALSVADSFLASGWSHQVDTVPSPPPRGSRAPADDLAARWRALSVGEQVAVIAACWIAITLVFYLLKQLPLHGSPLAELAESGQRVVEAAGVVYVVRPSTWKRKYGQPHSLGLLSLFRGSWGGTAARASERVPVPVTATHRSTEEGNDDHEC